MFASPALCVIQEMENRFQSFGRSMSSGWLKGGGQGPRGVRSPWTPGGVGRRGTPTRGLPVRFSPTPDAFPAPVSRMFWLDAA